MKYIGMALAAVAASTVCAVFSLLHGTAGPPVEPETSGAYYAAVYDGTKFWAAGSNGRIVSITAENQLAQQSSPTDQNLRDLELTKAGLIACGDHGTVVYQKNGAFQTAKTGVTENLLAVTEFQGACYAAGENGLLLRSQNGQSWTKVQTPVSADIIGIDANDSLLFAITSASDYMVSSDGVSWKSWNYNKDYKGYADLCTFTSLKNMGDTFFVIGQQKEHPDIPFVMFTEDGQVWFQKPLAEVNGLSLAELGPIRVYGIDCNLDQLMVACDKGRLLTVTSCAECNELGTYAENDLYDLVFGDQCLLLVGDAGTHQVVSLDAVRQYNIQPEQAYRDYLYSGAAIVDVRSDEEWASGHISGALHIPLDQIADVLPQKVPDRTAEVIFYCASGKRSQSALEKALEMGYRQVYNLGGIEDWPYALE